MTALFVGGPIDGERREIPGSAPAHVDVEVAVDADPVEIQPGGEFPPAVFETHRYVLDHVDSDPRAPEPRAKYSWQHKVPDGGA